MRIKKEKDKTVKPLTAGLAIGAALGAAAVVLSNKENQDKVKDAVQKAKKWAKETGERMKTEETLEENNPQARHLIRGNSN